MNEILNSGDTFLKNEIVEVVALYGIPKEEPKDKIIGILSKLIIPLIFIIGIIVYMKKVKELPSKK